MHCKVQVTCPAGYYPTKCEVIGGEGGDGSWLNPDGRCSAYGKWQGISPVRARATCVRGDRKVTSKSTGQGQDTTLKIGCPAGYKAKSCTCHSYWGGFRYCGERYQGGAAGSAPNNPGATSFEPSAGGVCMRIIPKCHEKDQKYGCTGASISAICVEAPKSPSVAARPIPKPIPRPKPRPIPVPWKSKFQLLSGTSCITEFQYHGLKTQKQCEDLCASMNCKFYSRPAGASLQKADKCWTTKTGYNRGACHEKVWKSPSAYARNPRTSCITHYTYAGVMTGLQCEQLCTSKRCKYYSRPAGLTSTASGKCWYTMNGHTSGTCNEDVFKRP